MNELCDGSREQCKRLCERIAALEKIAEAAKDYFEAIAEIPWIPFLAVVKDCASKETRAKMESACTKYSSALAELEKAEGAEDRREHR